MKNFILLLLSFVSLSVLSQTRFNVTTPIGAFARSLDISQNEVIVSQVTAAGVNICLFTINDGSLAHTATINVNTDTESNNWEHTLTIAHDFIAMGIPRNDTNATDAGVVRLYHKVSGNYVFLQQISAPDAEAGDFFGSFVELHNGVLYVSAIDEEADGQPSDTNTGAVYTYLFDGGQWNFSQKITASTETGMYEFGKKIRTENDQIIISSETSQMGYSNFHQYTETAGVLGDGNFMGVFGNLEDRVRDFDFQDGKLYLMVNALPDMSGLFNKVEIYDNPGTGYELDDIFYYPNLDGYVYEHIEVAGEKMFLGSSAWMLADTSRFPLVYVRKIGSEWTYVTQFFSQQSTINFDDHFGTVMANDGNNLIIGAPGEYEAMNPNIGQAYHLNLTLLKTADFTKSNVAIYPNPTQDKIYFTSAALNVKVYGVSGNLLLSAENATELSLQNLSTGMYLIKADTNEGQSQTFKIIKN